MRTPPEKHPFQLPSPPAGITQNVRARMALAERALDVWGQSLCEIKAWLRC